MSQMLPPIGASFFTADAHGDSLPGGERCIEAAIMPASTAIISRSIAAARRIIGSSGAILQYL